MSDLILYHYELSPFSAKVRLLLGYADLPWHSVIVPAMPPRPELAALTGGYRKIPVAQIGADVLCDSKSITSEIARRAGQPELAVENCTAEVQAFVRKCELDVFLAIFMLGGGAVLKTLLRHNSLWTTLRFLKDRAQIGRTARIKPRTGRQAKDLVADHLAQMESLLQGRDFLFAQCPCAADFSAYLDLWTATNLCGKRWLDEHPPVAAWYARMNAFGSGHPAPMDAAQALEIARTSEPAPITNPPPPQPVRIEPVDYARDASSGMLVGETEHAWILQRQHPQVDIVHVHFPKDGFRLRSSDQA